MLEGILGIFLYFPDDKREYIPAAISFFLFLVGAILTWRVFIKSSKNEEARMKLKEEEILKRASKKS